MEKQITIEGNQYTLKQGLKPLLKYEELTGRNAFAIQENLTDITLFFYCILSTVNKDFTYSREEFIDILDQHPELIKQYTDWMSEEVKDKKKAMKAK